MEKDDVRDWTVLALLAGIILMATFYGMEKSVQPYTTISVRCEDKSKVVDECDVDQIIYTIDGVDYKRIDDYE